MVDRKTSENNKNRIRLVIENWEINSDGTITIKDIGNKGYINAKWQFDDNPESEGTPLVKDTFLSDSTMQAFGYDSSEYDTTTVDNFFSDKLYYNITPLRNQELTDQQKSVARNNIGAVASSSLGVTTATLDPQTNKVTPSQTSASFETISTTQQINNTMAGKLIGTTNSTSISITIPSAQQVGVPVLTEIEFVRLGNGSVTFVPSTGVEILSLDNLKTIGNKNGVVMIKYLYNDKVLLVGDLI